MDDAEGAVVISRFSRLDTHFVRDLSLAKAILVLVGSIFYRSDLRPYMRTGIHIFYLGRMYDMEWLGVSIENLFDMQRPGVVKGRFCRVRSLSRYSLTCTLRYLFLV